METFVTLMVGIPLIVMLWVIAAAAVMLLISFICGD